MENVAPYSPGTHEPEPLNLLLQENKRGPKSWSQLNKEAFASLQ